MIIYRNTQQNRKRAKKRQSLYRKSNPPEKEKPTQKRGRKRG
jgi:hypothetical protein